MWLLEAKNGTFRISTMWGFKTLLLVLALDQVHGYAFYRKKIPNGMNVPHPCKKNSLWDGVGHLSQTGGGKRNPFGQDFKDQGFKWTTELCRKDSDKDGKTNGEELGDPGCLWKENMPDPPAPKEGLSHPGVCEPVDSDKCSHQTWVTCSGNKKKCPGKNETGVLTMEILFPKTNLPARETTYFCKTFELPSDQDYHIVATEPVLDNTLVIHHMILSGCKGDHVIEQDPYNCIMGNAKCSDSLGGWTVGQEDECFPKDAGMPFGKSTSRHVQLQVHWTNVEKRNDLYDGSGMRIYYTPKLRPYDLGVLATGQLHLEIPPKKKNVVQQGFCNSNCSKEMLDKPVNVSGATLHAHFLGKNMSLAQYRNGQFLRWLARDDVFSYNNPTTHLFNPPVLLKPGDELKTTCIYDSTGREKWTYYGDGTFEEMCFGFIYYYPKFKDNRKAGKCLSFERYTMCEFGRIGNRTLYEHNVGQCNLTEFESQNHIGEVLRACPYHASTCSSGCKYYVDKMNSHHCMKGFMRRVYDGALYKYNNVTALTVFKARNQCAKVQLHPSTAFKAMETIWLIYFAIGAGLFEIFFRRQ